LDEISWWGLSTWLFILGVRLPIIPPKLINTLYLLCNAYIWHTIRHVRPPQEFCCCFGYWIVVVVGCHRRKQAKVLANKFHATDRVIGTCRISPRDEHC
jgi:hypothetical protein